MKIALSIPTPPALTLALRSLPSSNWLAGQTFPATVVDVSRNGKVLLRIGGNLYTTDGNLPLTKGQTMQVQVTTTGKVPLLQVLPQARSPARSPEEIIANTLRQLLPRQQPIAQTLTTLFRAASSPQTQSVLPPDIQQLIKQLAAQLPAKTEINTAAAIKKVAQDSGSLLEHKLAAGSEASKTQTDLKAQILRLLQNLQQWFPKELATNARTPAPTTSPQKPAAELPQPRQSESPTQQPVKQSKPPADNAKQQEFLLQQTLNLIKQNLEALLARTTLNQLQSLRTTERETIPTLIFELPIRADKENIDVFRFTVGRDEAGAKQKADAASWSITLEFDLTGLGPVRVRVSVQNEAVNAWFWAERPETVDLFNTHMDWLKDDMRASGIAIEAHDCQLGALAQSGNINSGPILNTRA